jgi:hypothetical protein
LKIKHARSLKNARSYWRDNGWHFWIGILIGSSWSRSSCLLFTYLVFGYFLTTLLIWYVLILNFLTSYFKWFTVPFLDLWFNIDVFWVNKMI